MLGPPVFKTAEWLMRECLGGPSRIPRRSPMHSLRSRPASPGHRHGPWLCPCHRWVPLGGDVNPYLWEHLTSFPPVISSSNGIYRGPGRGLPPAARDGPRCGPYPIFGQRGGTHHGLFQRHDPPLELSTKDPRGCPQRPAEQGERHGHPSPDRQQMALRWH